MTSQFSMDDDFSPFREYLRFSESRPFRRILALAKKMHCTTVKVRPCHECLEWEAEKQEFFEGCPRISGDLTRFDFFGTTETGSEIYMGYTILRPAPLSSVVEAIVPVPTDGENHFLTCKASWDVDVDGSRHTVTGLLLMEQDATVSRCAHSSLRMATSLLDQNFAECEAMTSSTVSQVLRQMPAHEDVQKQIPSEGLTVPQITTCLAQAGYATVTYDFRDRAKLAARGIRHQPEQIVYGYVESGIPVILAIVTEKGPHSLVVVGHTYDPHSWWSDAESGYFPKLFHEDKPWLSASLWSPQFVILDDNFGAYLNMSRETLRAVALGAIVPLPPSLKLYLTPDEAESIAAYALYHQNLIRLFADARNLCEWKDHLSARQIDKQLVLRTLLLPRALLFEHLAGPVYTPEVLAELGSLDLPDWLCMTEVSIAGMYSSRLKLGEVILDPRVPGSMVSHGIEPILSIHLPGFLVMGAYSRDAKVIYPTSDQPRDVYARPDYAMSEVAVTA